MRLLIEHETTFRFEPAARFVNGIIRLSPRNHEGQYVAKWRVALDTDGRLKPSDDGFGNVVHGVALTGPLDGVTLRVEGEVSTFDTAGVLHGTIERFPPAFFLRGSPLTEGSRDLHAYSKASAGAGDDPLGRLHGLLAAIHRDFSWQKEVSSDPPLAAAAVFAAGAADAAGLAHVFIAGTRQLALPARFACGYCLTREDTPARGLHAWAEAYVPGLGWIAFDPALGYCPSETHVRVACGLDAVSTAPFRLAGSGQEQVAPSDLIQISQIFA